MHNAKDNLEKSRQGLIAATEGLSEAQWNFKPSPGCWSIAEILEHVVMTQELVLGPVLGRLSNAPPAPADHDRDTVDALIVNNFPNRSVKFKGPEVLQPIGRVAPSEALDRLNQTCARIADCVYSRPDLREHAVDSPPLKAISQGKYQFIDGYQLMLAMAGHNERHLRQILEVKADGSFPAHENRAASVA